MRIARSHWSAKRLRQLDDELEEVVQSAGRPGRVCSKACNVVCNRCGSTGCQCACSPNCPQAPFVLSDDPARYPIEPAIVPLVFEMKRLGHFEACWSCEGHLSADGSIWKLPSLWFYSRSLAYLRLLGNGVANLGNSGRLSATWHIALTFSDNDNPDATFALEPMESGRENYKLPALQSDLKEIAGALQPMMSQEARRLQQDFIH